jgi:hypothetical protein
MEDNRRNRLDLMHPSEKAILDAMQVLEQAGAHPRLTEVTQILQQAKDKLSDYFDDQEEESTQDSQPTTPPPPPKP